MPLRDAGFDMRQTCPIKVPDAWITSMVRGFAVRHEINDVASLAGTTVAVPGLGSRPSQRGAGSGNTGSSARRGSPRPDIANGIGQRLGSLGTSWQSPICADFRGQSSGLSEDSAALPGRLARTRVVRNCGARRNSSLTDPEIAQRVAELHRGGAEASSSEDRAAAAERLSEGGYLPQLPRPIAQVLNEGPTQQHAAYVASGATEPPRVDQASDFGFQPYAYPSTPAIGD
ncbi:hypothetical protein FQA39_LY18942 [Lamprigera yunnana]|nr:hypothetical protein FQA39_LY18942 [Lamprigera yunnana]